MIVGAMTEAKIGVAAERQRDPGVERRRHRLVIARERVMDRVADRRLDLLRCNLVRLGGAIEQDPHALAAGPELPHPISAAIVTADNTFGLNLFRNLNSGAARGCNACSSAGPKRMPCRYSEIRLSSVMIRASASAWRALKVPTGSRRAIAR